MRPLVIVPTYNERENVRRLLPQLLDIPELRVLVVDDASPDGTGFAAEVLSEDSDGRLKVMHRIGRPRGLGHASLDGIRYALDTNADVICQMDADLSHQPSELRVMLNATAHSDLVIGSRYVPGGRIVNRPRRHQLLSAGVNACVRTICSMPVHDCTSGFRGWRRDALASLPLHRIDAEGPAFLAQLLYEALAIGCAVSEVPITFVERERGRSKLLPRHIAELALVSMKLALSGAASTTRATTAAAPIQATRLPAADSGPR